MDSIYVLFGFVLLLKGSLSDFHSAVDDMMPLIKTEESILQSLKRYVTEMDEKLKKLQWHLDNFEKEHEKASQNLEEYVFNPINAFTLIKRLTLNWNDIQNEMTRNPGRGKYNFKRKTQRGPLKYYINILRGGRFSK